ncbi:uncharacterized protein LOC131432972 [Malaya genurostris]|uniref:uncharacterized protein LOC131432972 n=1 Tax=Malaya genurostris TaxID=325434 RepID=UPI0026F3F48E|nr:uncharacterized protein LOC131432972 [Malaya genurostris]XP_058455642.1 uncharacterized protein LOC131432972 [Malaya genurostris]
MILAGDLVFRLHSVVLFQCFCTAMVAVAVLAAAKTSSSTTTTTVDSVAVGGSGIIAGSGSLNGNCSDNIIPMVSAGGSRTRAIYDDKLRPVAMQKYHRLSGELGQSCSNTEDCRPDAYECGDIKQICECAPGYRPDDGGRSCVGAIGKRCQYDAHCITNAYCKGQMICTCKREYEYLSEDKWSCQASAAESLLRIRRSASPPPPPPPSSLLSSSSVPPSPSYHSMSGKSTPTSWWLPSLSQSWTLLAALLGSGGGAIIIPLVLVSSWQLKINLFTV